MSRFLETDIGEQEKYEKRIHTFVDYTVNDLRHEFKFENRVKNKSNFFTQNISFLIKNVLFFYSWESIFLRFLRIQLP